MSKDKVRAVVSPRGYHLRGWVNINIVYNVFCGPRGEYITFISNANIYTPNTFNLHSTPSPKKSSFILMWRTKP